MRGVAESVYEGASSRRVVFSSDSESESPILIPDLRTLFAEERRAAEIYSGTLIITRIYKDVTGSLPGNDLTRSTHAKERRKKLTKDL